MADYFDKNGTYYYAACTVCLVAALAAMPWGGWGFLVAAVLAAIAIWLGVQASRDRM